MTPQMPTRSWLLPVLATGALALVLTAQVLLGPAFTSSGRFQAWQAVLVSIVLQAMPFLVLGTLISSALLTRAPARVLQRFTPSSPALAVPAAALWGVALPACECASVPVSQTLLRKGLPPSAALTFLLASPAINPVVIAATFVAFPDRPAMAAARFTASLLAAVLVGWLWLRVGRNAPPAMRQRPHNHGHSFADAFISDFTQASGFLVLGAMVAAAIKVTVAPTVFLSWANYAWALIALMAALAVVMSLCSEADAFVAASFVTVPPTAQLVFLVVGPMVDIKLFAMQSGAFGTRFAARFMSLTLLVCVAVASMVGWLFF